MTEEEKRLLLQDLCSRLLYGVICKVEDTQEPVKLKGITPDRNKPLEIYDDGEEKSSTYYYINEVKPYLRPMSSMTEEENKEFQEIKLSYHFDEDSYILLDWLNAHHFDYRGLVDLGLAIEAPEGMYKTK